MAGGDGAIETFLVLVAGVGLLALAVGLVGLAAGGLDPVVLATRPRLAVLAAAGLALLFAGAAPPTPAPAQAVQFPDPRPPTSIQDALHALERSHPAPARAPAVFPEQAHTYAQWEKALLVSFSKAERAIEQVPAVLEGLISGRLDRFTAWVHLGRLAQDIKQAHLALHDLRPPALLDLAQQKALDDALRLLHYSLANQREAVSRLQRHTRTWRPEDLETAAARLREGYSQRQRGLAGLVQLKAQLGLIASLPAPASGAGPRAGR